LVSTFVAQGFNTEEIIRDYFLNEGRLKLFTGLLGCHSCA